MSRSEPEVCEKAPNPDGPTRAPRPVSTVERIFREIVEFRTQPRFELATAETSA